MRETTSLNRAVDRNVLDEVIDLNKVYYVRVKGQNPIAQKYGKDWVKITEMKPRKIGKKNFYSWVDFLSSGKLPNLGAMYEIITYQSGADSPVLVFAGVASQSDNLESNTLTLSDNPNQEQKTVIPYQNYNKITEQSNFRTLADSMQFQTNQTIQTLQDELERRDTFLRDIQQENSLSYDRISEKEKQFYDEREKIMHENLQLHKDMEAIKRELEIEKLRNSIEKESREQVLKLERKLDKMENSKTDWGKTLSDLVGLSGNIPMLMNVIKGGGGLPPMMANATTPNYDYDEETIRTEDLDNES